MRVMEVAGSNVAQAGTRDFFYCGLKRRVAGSGEGDR